MANGRYRRTREQLDEHRLEIENRIRNLFWTVSGDYTLKIRPNVEEFARSPYIALYDAIKQGAFAKYYDADALGLYVLKKTALSKEERPLLELTQLAIDLAVYPLTRENRKGVDEIRRQTFADILQMEADVQEGPAAGAAGSGRKPRTEAGADAAGKRSAAERDRRGHKSTPSVFRRALHRMMLDYLVSETEKGAATAEEAALARRLLPQRMEDPEAEGILKALSPLEKVSNTDKIIGCIDRVYNRYYDPSFEEQHGDLARVQELSANMILDAVDQECYTDDEMQEIMKKFLSNLRMDMLRLKLEDRKGADLRMTREHLKKIRFAEATDESAQKVHAYVELSYGRSYLREAEEKQKNAVLCRGLHKGCSLHFTEGILHDPVKKNNQYRYSEMLTQKNRMYYYGNHRIIKRNIANLAEALVRMLVLRSEKEIWRDRSGEIVPARLWKLGRTQDEKLFNKTAKHDDSDFVVEILLDGSGSQMKRQTQVAAQGYIISEALSRAGIPPRVNSFCTFWDYTILHRFRDYEDDRERNERIFEYQGSASNRDGLAIRAVCEDLLNRTENHKILIILSDGRPNDIGRSSKGGDTAGPYLGDEAVRDTAFEVRKARANGISVLGIFAGYGDDLEAEKKIFGNDFAYIRNIANFSKMVETYLCRQIDAEP